MAKTKQRETRGRGAAFRAVAADAVPLRDLFYPWQCVDWRAISERIDEGQAVCVENIEGDTDNWVRCALSELGRVRVTVTTDYEASVLWVLPKAVTDGIALEDEAVYS